LSQKTWINSLSLNSKIARSMRVVSKKRLYLFELPTLEIIAFHLSLWA